MEAARPAGGLLLAVAALWAQGTVLPANFGPDWRRIGSSAVEMSLAALASGPVERIWFTPDGAALRIQTASGKTFQTKDFESWAETPEGTVPSPLPEAPALRRPEPAAVVRAHPGTPGRLYALGSSVYRSEDAGRSWANLTAWRQDSIIGGGLRDLAVSPLNPDDIAVANDFGVWRSLDGGVSWSGLNDSLPNLPVRRLLSLPQGMNGARVVLDRAGAAEEVEWTPGERVAWKPNSGAATERETERRRGLSRSLRVTVTALAEVAPYVYAGSADGRIWVSADEGRSWLEPRAGSGAAVDALWVDPGEPRRALAALAASDGPRLLRTVNGGLFWDDISANLPNAPLHGVAADRLSGAVYAASQRGLYFALADLRAAGPAPRWTPVGGSLPAAAVRDVRLDEEGNQLYVALEGHGVFAATAPHRQLDPRVVSAADYSARAAAPGALLSVLGGRVSSARAGDRTVPVLAATDTESQIQVPFDAAGSSMTLGLDVAGALLTRGVPLRTVSPVIFVDRDGAPMVLDADRGLMLDAMTPARSGFRIQILATGLGRVRPDWPTGLAAPLVSPPRVVAGVRVYLDRSPVEVTRATLAPGYIGFYLVEVQLPEIVNSGPAELYLEADGQLSNRVSVHLRP